MTAATSIATAERLLQRFGEAVTLTYTTDSVIDPATGDVDHEGETVIVTGNGYPADYMAKDVDGANILQGDIRLIVEKLSVRPQKGWTATVDSKSYRVMDVKTIRKTGVDVITICQLRAQ